MGWKELMWVGGFKGRWNYSFHMHICISLFCVVIPGHHMLDNSWRAEMYLEHDSEGWKVQWHSGSIWQGSSCCIMTKQRMPRREGKIVCEKNKKTFLWGLTHSNCGDQEWLGSERPWARLSPVLVLPGVEIQTGDVERWRWAEKQDLLNSKRILCIQMWVLALLEGRIDPTRLDLLCYRRRNDAWGRA